VAVKGGKAVVQIGNLSLILLLTYSYWLVNNFNH
jgi:hypothetical protein